MTATKDALDIQAGYGGGLNHENPLGMAPNQYALNLEFRLSKNGTLVPRMGTRRLHLAAFGAPSPVAAGMSWRPGGTPTEVFVVNGHLFTAVLTFVPPLRLLATDRGGGMNTNVSVGAIPTDLWNYSMVHFRDATNECVYVADGLGSLGGGPKPLSKWDGTTYTAHNFGAAGIKFRFLWVYNQRLFGVTGEDQTLYWSALNNGDSLGDVAAGGGFQVVRTFGARRLIGGMVIGGTAFLFHDDGISLFRGSSIDDVNIQAGALGLTGDVGPLSHHAAVALDGYGYVLTRRGLYLLTEGAFRRLDDPERPDPTTATGTDVGLLGNPNTLVSSGYRARMLHVSRHQELWCWDASGASALVYSYGFGRWVGAFNWQGSGPGPIWETISPGSATETVLLLGSPDGFVRGAEGGTTDATGFETYLDNVAYDGTGGLATTGTVKGRTFWGGDPEAQKDWRAFSVVARLNGNATVQVTGTDEQARTATKTIAQPPSVGNTKLIAYRVPAVPAASQSLDTTIACTLNPPIELARVVARGEPGAPRGY